MKPKSAMSPIVIGRVVVRPRASVASIVPTTRPGLNRAICAPLGAKPALARAEALAARLAARDPAGGGPP